MNKHFTNLMNKPITFADLLGKELVEVTGCEKKSGAIVFKCKDGRTFQLYHTPECCEDVRVEDVCGEVSDLIGSPILQAEVSNSGNTDNATEPRDFSHTWTFYRITTMKGQVVIRWLGESNGYYSEEVDFCELI